MRRVNLCIAYIHVIIKVQHIFHNVVCRRPNTPVYKNRELPHIKRSSRFTYGTIFKGQDSPSVR